jgi:CheY-like chemotaxis protein
MQLVLIIDDDPIVAHVYEKVLTTNGYQVIVAADGRAGLEQIRTARPDAVLVDLLLPKLSGVDLMREVRRYQEFAQTPIIAYTNVFLPPLVEAARNAGATQVFGKSTLTPAMLLDAFRKELGEQQRAA